MQKHRFAKVGVIGFFVLTLVIGWPLSGSVQGAPKDGYSAAFKACMKDSGGVTAAMRACHSNEYRRLDAVLNRDYKSVMRQLQTKDLKQRLIESQRVWLRMRAQRCMQEVEQSGAKGGTAGDVIYDSCQLNLLQKRIEWLRKVPSNPGYLTKVRPV